MSGPTVHNLVVDRLGAKVAQYKVVPDDRTAIEATLVEWVDDLRLDLILTTGGTGFSPRDVTPEATRAVVERETPALVQAMLFESLRVTPYAMLTRATAGIRKRSLIVNLPGNPKAATENLDAIAEVLPHALDIIRGVDTHAGSDTGQSAAGGRHASHTGHAGHGAAPAADAQGAAHGHADSHSDGAGAHGSHGAAHAHGAAAPAATGGIARNVGGPPC